MLTRWTPRPSFPLRRRPDDPSDPRSARRQALADFDRRRDELAAGNGVPGALTHSPSASRQWISDELAEAAGTLADRAREEGAAWLNCVWRHTLTAVGSSVLLLFLAQLLSSLLTAGWTSAHTAGLLAALLTAAPLTAAAYRHRSSGGVLAPLTGEDNRLSTSRAVAAAWVLLVVYAVLFLALQLAFAGGTARRDALLSGLDLPRSGGLLTVLALGCGVAVFLRRTVTVRVQTQRLQKVRAAHPRAADLLTDDAGRGSFSDVQYVLVNAAALLFAAVRLARQPEQLPDLPWGLALLVVVSIAAYLAGKYAEGGRPVVLSVVRAREPGDLHAPIRTGDDIEIRGAGFVPPGAHTPDRLARTVVRVGAVHVNVPLIPVAGGFTNPADTTLTVPVPVEVEPGRVEIQVITAAGVETNRYTVDIAD
ncbi:hypothetical protein ACWG0Q_33555 [Actinacidiphila sp. SB3-2]